MKWGCIVGDDRWEFIENFWVGRFLLGSAQWITFSTNGESVPISAEFMNSKRKRENRAPISSGKVFVKGYLLVTEQNPAKTCFAAL